MAPLTGLQIQKLLPKTNCKECGSNTCLAFAMKLAAKKTELAECPYVSDEAKATLGSAAEPPIRAVAIGSEGKGFVAGGETVMFRHEKTFVNQTGIGVALSDRLTPSEIEGAVRQVGAYCLERVGEELRVDLLSVAFKSASQEGFVSTVERVSGLWERAVAIRTDDLAALAAAAAALKGRKPLLASATSDTVDELLVIAQDTGSVLAMASDTLDGLAAMVEKARAVGFKDVVLELRASTLSEHVQNSIVIRRGALKAGLKSLGYPTLKFVDAPDPVDAALEAGIEVAKYGGITVLPAFDPAAFVSLLALRQNIYTDPQKPIQVDPKVYPIGEPDENSPVFVTTNFSLTYFIVSGEIENAGLSAWLLIPECEGMSVLTAWAAGKFGGDQIGAFAKEVQLAEQTQNRKIVIPGYVAQISGELEEALPGWEVLVGPQEAGDLESFIGQVLVA
jgi:acetyl-CoA decarbonylase/synthase complex subunit gamma